MLRFLYLTINFLPYWSIPLALIFAEMAMIFRRRGSSRAKIRMAVLSLYFFLLTVSFFAFRWEKNLYPWIVEAFHLD